MYIKHLLTVAALCLTAASVASAQDSSQDAANSVGVSFPNGSQSTAILARDGKQYLIDTARKTVTEIPQSAGSEAQTQATTQAQVAPGSALFLKNCSGCHGVDGKGNKAIGTPNFTDPAFIHAVSAAEMQKVIHTGIPGRMPAWSGRLNEADITDLVSYVRSLDGETGHAGGRSSSEQPGTNSGPGAPVEGQPAPDIYQPGDDVLISLPTGRPTDRHGLYMNFAHRFPYDPTFTGTGRGQELFGLDGVALPSLGLRYGVTDRLSVSLYRSPSLVNRPIQLMAGYNLLEEIKGDPLNLMVRASIEGQNNFRKNYTENIEAILSRSITKRAQVYLVPTISFNDRPLVQPLGFASDQILDLPGVNTFALGVGLSIDIRPTVALMAEVIPTLVNASELGIHRPAFSFGIQKKIWRHAFTLALTNSPGTTVSQRADTRAEFLGEPGADTFGGLTLGFNITRQIK